MCVCACVCVCLCVCVVCVCLCVCVCMVSSMRIPCGRCNILLLRTLKVLVMVWIACLPRYMYVCIMEIGFV